MKSPPLVGYVVSHPIQYQAPLFRRLAVSKSIDFVALFGSRFGVRPSYDPQFGRVVDFGIDLLGGYRSLFLRQIRERPDIDKFFGLMCPRLGTFWQQCAPVLLVLHGWRTAMMWQAACASKWRRVPYFIRAETPKFLSARTSPRTVRSFVRDAAVRRFVRNAMAALSLGAANDRFYLQMGVSPERLIRVPYFVDIDAVRSAAEEGRLSKKEVRARFGIPPNAFVIVVAAKLIPRKRPLDLIRVLQGLPEEIHLAWVGSGEMFDAAVREVEVLGLSDRVHLCGFLGAADTWRLFGASDVCALPAEAEPWGLAINEGVAAGLPVLATNECGAAEDLIASGKTGEILPVGQQDAWREAISRWFARVKRGDRGDRELMETLSARHSVEAAASAMEGAALRAFT